MASMLKKCLPFVFLAAALSACASQHVQPVENTTEDAAAQLHALIDAAWQRQLRESPVTGAYVGDDRYNDRWPDVSLEALAASHEADLETLEKLKQIDRAALSPDEQINYELFQGEYEKRVGLYEHRDYLMPVNQLSGIQNLDTELAQNLTFETVKDYENWIRRLQGFGRYMDQTIVLLQAGIDAGRTQPKVINARVLAQIEAQRVRDPARSGFYAPFREFAARIPQEDRERLAQAGRAAIAQHVIPAFDRMATFYKEKYMPASRPEVGVGVTPNGKDYYAFLARRYTTTELTPEEIHQVGLDEVARIRKEMEAIIRQVGFKGSFPEFLAYLRTNPKFYYKDPAELLEAYQAMAKRIDPELVKLFGHLPRTPYGVIPIPMAIAPDTYTAYYMPPAADGSRPGYYNVNLHKPEARPKYEMEALTAHESVPGHHLQIAIQQELGELPEFRRFSDYTAFTEGWALYGESLGPELGLYKDPYSKFGQLTYEMWRAVRLVVDTGMHYKGWTREQAIDFFMKKAAKTKLDITNEVDRYIAWPGQALAYKIGELKIKALRARAEKALGDDFDIKAFHDTVLGAGAMPLNLLEKRVNAWIDAEKTKT